MHICSKGSGNFIFLGTLWSPPVNTLGNGLRWARVHLCDMGPQKMINLLWVELRFKWSSTGKWGEEKYYVSAVHLEGILLLCPPADSVMAKLHWHCKQPFFQQMCMVHRVEGKETNYGLRSTGNEVMSPESLLTIRPPLVTGLTKATAKWMGLWLRSVEVHNGRFLSPVPGVLLIEGRILESLTRAR